MMLASIRYYILFSICLFLFSCSDNGDTPIYGCIDPNSENYCDYCNVDDGSCDCGIDVYTYTFDDIVNALSGYECSNCHFASNGLNSGTNFNIEDYASVKSRINGCASFETSYLLEKITTGNMASYADDALIEILEIWISQGAPE